MFIALVALGLALVAFGAVVLIRFADRPGGSFKGLGVEVSSTGAGLPLVGLGVGIVIFAVIRTSSDSGTGLIEGSSSPRPLPVSSAAGAPAAPAAALLPAGFEAACFADLATDLPADRVHRVEVGMSDLEVVGAHQGLTQPFTLLLTENGAAIGGVRLRLFEASNTSANLYRIESALDGGCAPVVEMRNLSRGGDPRALTNWDTVRLTLGGAVYDLRIGGETNITVGHFTRAG